MKVCHMTSAHSWNDVRIFLKECQSLAAAGYDVYLVAEGIDREVDSVHIVGCGDKPASRKDRMRGFARRVYEKALSLDCDVYHFHDPELLPYGIKLKELGKKVIFDSHEDVSGQIMDKYWIPKCLRWIVSKLYKSYETYAVGKFDAVITATPHIAELFQGRAKKIVVINNYPKLDDIKFHNTPFAEREPIVCYAGGINKLRGEDIMVEAMKGVNGKLILAGPCDSGKRYKSIEGGANVFYLGSVGRREINSLYGKAVVGLILLRPNENYQWSKPIKMYEYMAAGIPFICSDFPLWKEVTEATDAGICVPYNDIEAIRKEIAGLLSNREKAQQMGLNGYHAVKEKYNWENEAVALKKLYGGQMQYEQY